MQRQTLYPRHGLVVGATPVGEDRADPVAGSWPRPISADGWAGR